MTNKDFEEKQRELNEQIYALMRELAEHEQQWYNEINRRLDFLRGRCFKTRGCAFMVRGGMHFRKTSTEFFFDPDAIPVMMLADNGKIVNKNIYSSALMDNETGEAILKAFRKEFEEIPKEEFIGELSDILFEDGLAKEVSDDGAHE